MAKKEFPDNYVFHTRPSFYINGWIESGTAGDANSGSYDVTITGNSDGIYLFNMYLMLFSKAGAGKPNANFLALIKHFYIGELNHLSDSLHYSGNFTGAGNEKILLAMICQVCTNNQQITSDYQHTCNIGKKSDVIDGIDYGYGGAIAGGKADSEVDVTEIFDIKPLVDANGWENDDGAYIGRYFTAASFVIQDAITYNVGVLKFVAKSRSIDGTDNVIKITPKYTPASSNGASAFYAAYENKYPNISATDTTNLADFSKSKIYVLVYRNDGENTFYYEEGNVQNNKEITLRVPLSDLPANVKCYVTIRVLEVFPDDSREMLKKYVSLNGITLNGGTLKIDTGSSGRTGDGSSISARAVYTPGANPPATVWWGTDNENIAATSINKDKILLRLYDGTTQVGADKLIAYTGDTVSWSGLDKTKTYNIIASIAEQLSSANLLTDAYIVNGYAANGSIKILDGYGRTEGNLTFAAKYTGSGAEFWYGRRASTTKTNARLNKVLLIVTEEGGDYTTSSMYQAVDNGGSYTFTVDKYKSYDIYATCIESIGGTNAELKLDGPINIPSDTKPIDPTDVRGMNGTVTGTTVTLQPVFEFGDIKEIEWTAKLGRVIQSGKSTPSFSDSVKFQLLSNATTYTIIFHGLHSGTVNTNSDAVDAEGHPIAVDTSAYAINLANSDVSYDCLTYGVAVSQYAIDRNTFEGRLFQTIGAHGETYHMLVECGEKGYTGYCRTRDGSSIGNSNVGTISINGTSIFVTGLQPSTSYRLYVKLTNCRDFNGDLDATNYIDFTTEAIVIPGTFTARVTGTSVTITPNIIRWNNTDGVGWTATVHKDSPTGAIVGTAMQLATRTSLPTATITGLKTGTKYYITFTGIDDSDNNIAIDGIEIITYGLKLSLGTSYTRMIRDSIMTYIEGERASSTVQDASRGSAVKYYVVDSAGNKVISDTTINCRRANPNTFDSYPDTALDPNTNYTMYAYIEGVIYNGNPDTLISASFTTKRVASNFNGTTSATGETIRVTPTWVSSNSPNNEVLVSVALYGRGVLIEIKETTMSGTDLWFTGLERGLEHTAVIVAEDNEGNHMENFLQYTSGFGGVLTETTYKLTFSNISKSTRSVQWTCTCNRALPAGRVIEYEITENEVIRMDWTGTMASGATKSYTQFAHYTPFRVRCRIQEMRDRDGDWDTVEEFYDITKKLTVEMKDYISHVHIIETKWQALADGLSYDKDPISGIEVAFSVPDIVIKPAITGKGYIGSNYGVYYPNRVRYFTGLTGGREYVITICVTDGINKAYYTVNLWALIQLMRIYDEQSGTWMKALPYVATNKVDGQRRFWPAPAYIFNNGVWKDTDPERIHSHF